MGTNYYTVKNICECCNRYDQFLHIGKSSSGWTFTFQGYKDALSMDYSESITILSYKDWLEYLAESKAFIKDEYGSDVTLEDFKKLVENKRSAKNNHASYCKIHYPTSDDWLDEEGNSFSAGDFS